jgi:hypothetical protein
MTQCRTFQCQEQLPGVGDCKLRERVEALEATIRSLIEDAMPSNWDDEEHEAEHVAAWRGAMTAIGEDPEDYKGG